MTQVSKYPITKQVYLRSSELLAKILINLESENETAKFLDGFLTPTEKVMLIKRLAAAFLIEKNYDYRQISRILRVSTGTVGRVALSYKKSAGFQKAVKDLLKDEKVNDFWTEVGEKVASVLAAGGSKAGSWFYLKEKLRKKKASKPF